MQKITPFFWFDHQAQEATAFYVSLFDNSRIISAVHYGQSIAEISGMPAGSLMMIDFQLAGQTFTALNGGPEFAFTPAVSFFVICETEAEVADLWAAMSAGGTALMPLGRYAWSKKYGWAQDRYGLSWQITLGKTTAMGQKFTPSLLFVGKQHGKAESAIRFYTSIFPESAVAEMLRYAPGEPEPEGTVKYAQFSLHGQSFVAMDSSLDHPFSFNEAISFVVHCETQEEVDYYWEKLSAGGEEGSCGWLKDRYGISWQIVPVALREMLQDEDAAKSDRVMRALLPMKKPDIATLRAAYAQP